MRGRKPLSRARSKTSRQHLIDAASTILRLQGAGEITQNSVASLAGYSPTLVYYYWNTIGALKEELRSLGVVSQVDHVCECSVCLRTYGQTNKTAAVLR